MTTFRHAVFPADLISVTAIFREYMGSVTVSLCFQDYESEIAELPGKYAPPDGRLLLACEGDTLLGCAALRRVDAVTCEMKRVYVRPTARGQRIGRQLVLAILSEAKQAGYSKICLDVLPEFTAARQLYASLGFLPADPVSFNPVAGAQFLALNL